MGSVMANKARLQFRIATLLWLMACVASFFGGRHWDQIAKPAPKRATPAMAPPGATSLQLAAGTATVVQTSLPIHRMLVADPTIISILPVSQSSFQVKAMQAGKTKIAIWGESTNQTASYDVRVL
jgi:Flp pilus assembly secretin CpaC